MYPAAEDNYGYDACAVLCLPCVPNILVIATESGMLYHCVVLEAEEEEDGGVRQTEFSQSIPQIIKCSLSSVRDSEPLCFCAFRL